MDASLQGYTALLKNNECVRAKHVVSAGNQPCWQCKPLSLSLQFVFSRVSLSLRISWVASLLPVWPLHNLRSNAKWFSLNPPCYDRKLKENRRRKYASALTFYQTNLFWNVFLRIQNEWTNVWRSVSSLNEWPPWSIGDSNPWSHNHS